MIGELDPNQKKVSIVGAGISGLLMGYHLKKKGYEVQIYESSSRVGGLVQTQSSHYGMVETAAHSLLVNTEVEAFFHSLGLELIPVQPKSKARYIYRDGKMRRMPLSLFEIVRTFITFFSKPKTILQTEKLSLEEWGNAFLGKAATQFLLAPFVSGVFACSPHELSAKAAFPQLVPPSPDFSLFQWMKHRKKIVGKKPRPQMKTLKGGLQSLIDRLEQELKGHIHLNHPIKDLSALEGNRIVTVPAPILSSLLHSIDSASSQALRNIPYAPLITCTVFLKKDQFLKGPPQGVGVLIPRTEGFRILGCLFNSSAFAGRVYSDQMVSLTLMMGGTSDPAALNLTSTEIKEILDTELRRLFQTQSPPMHIEITRWPKAIPIFSEQLREAQMYLKIGFSSQKGRVIFSNFSESVSIRSLIERITRQD